MTFTENEAIDRAGAAHADRNPNKARSVQETAMAEFHVATKELRNLNREMRRLTRARDFAGFDALREHIHSARARSCAAMLAVVRSNAHSGPSDEVASEATLNGLVGRTP